MFLFNRQEPIYEFDHMLPTAHREVWQSSANSWDLAQLKVANALARKNVAISRSKTKTGKPHPDKLEVNMRVYARHLGTKNKLEYDWEPGYRIIDFETSRTAVIEHSRTGARCRRDISHLRQADPASELLDNTAIDVLPGRSSMYFHSKDLPDLNWPAMADLAPLGEDVARKAIEIQRDRLNDKGSQPTPVAAPSAKGGGASNDDRPASTRPQRTRRRPDRFEDFYFITSMMSLAKMRMRNTSLKPL